MMACGVPRERLGGGTPAHTTNFSLCQCASAPNVTGTPEAHPRRIVPGESGSSVGGGCSHYTGGTTGTSGVHPNER